jgi:hypothetical protein
MKKLGLLLVALALAVVVLGAIIFSVALVVPRLPVDSVKCFDWMDICHGAIVGIYLTTDALWVTNYSRKITFLFSVENISGFPNATTFYDNSYVILNSVRLDSGYMINVSESPFKQLSERQGWSVEWYFTPKADNFILACMGISKGKQLQYPLFLEVNYTVVDSEGVQWLCLFQNWATITIVGGEDAP